MDRFTYQYNFGSQERGFSLVELLVALAIFAIVASSVAIFSNQVMQADARNEDRLKALSRLKEYSQTLIRNKDTLWMNIRDYADNTPRHFLLSDGKYTIEDGIYNDGEISYYFVIEGVYRDVNDNIVDTGGTEDKHTKCIVLTAEWVDEYGRSRNVKSYIYVNDWNTKTWIDTTIADFSAGMFDFTETSAVGDGAVQLQPKLYSNWCLPELMISSYDLPGSAVGNVITAEPGNVYIGTGKEFSDPGAMAFMHTTVDTDDPPNIAITGTFSGYVVNDIYGSGGYAYLATTDDAKEVVILQIANDQFLEVGYFDISGTNDALSVFVVGNRGYVSAGRYLYVFDVTSKSGSRPLLGSIRASPLQLPFTTASVPDIYVVGNYAYCSLYNDWYEMTIINVSNPSAMTITARADLNWAQATTLFVSPDGNRTYIGTGSSSGKEFYILNTSNKSSVSVVNSYETNGMSVKGLSVIDNRAIIVGRNGEEYQVVDVSNESNLVKCGGMQVNSGISDIATVNYNEILYSYILTGDVSGEYKIIRGGLDSGGGADGRGFVSSGSFISRVLDSGSDTTNYYSLQWEGALPAGADLRMQVRAGDTPDLGSFPWVGPDGTNGTYFTIPGEAIPRSLSDRRYFQYRVLFDSNTDVTPIYESITVDYQ